MFIHVHPFSIDVGSFATPFRCLDLTLSLKSLSRGAEKVLAPKSRTSSWQRCKGCGGRYPRKDLRRCGPQCSHLVCFACDACGSCNKQPEARESREHSFIRGSGSSFMKGNLWKR